jgi:membrane-associated protease RseP (regulator of RpoE activity)
MRFLCGVIFSVGLLCATGCINHEPLQPRRIEEIRPNPPLFKSISLTLQRRDFVSQLGRRGDNTIRLVPVFQSAVSPESYVYRVFDVKPKSVYTLLGLQNSDIIVAVDGFLVRKPEQFVAYTQLLQNEDASTVEIQRSGEAILLRYTFIPSVKGPAPMTSDGGSPPKTTQQF